MPRARPPRTFSGESITRRITVRLVHGYPASNVERCRMYLDKFDEQIPVKTGMARIVTSEPIVEEGDSPYFFKTFVITDLSKTAYEKHLLKKNVAAARAEIRHARNGAA